MTSSRVVFGGSKWISSRSYWLDCQKTIFSYTKHFGISRSGISLKIKIHGQKSREIFGTADFQNFHTDHIYVFSNQQSLTNVSMLNIQYRNHVDMDHAVQLKWRQHSSGVVGASLGTGRPPVWVGHFSTRPRMRAAVAFLHPPGPQGRARA